MNMHLPLKLLGEILALCALVVVALIAWFIIHLAITVRRAKVRLNAVRERLRPLPDTQLIEIMRTPTHPDSQFALAELMRRGVDARPTKDQLFDMLTSGNPALCGQAMTNLQVFYPELPIPDGASNLDPPDLWRSRIEAFRQAG
ncbi:MAG TPA: hypothetical protein VMV72_15460 [Verrucomicrobiae bacterium]|nr:hypothetical protein [Verrucomicrobiae bacterium]